jgi:plasmid replication initiation protein
MAKKKPKKSNIAQISNPFLEAFVKNNDLVSFKVLLYIAKAKLDEVLDLSTLDKDQVHKVPIDLNSVAEYLDLDIRTIRKSIEKLNNTSINFRKIDENGDDVEEFISLLPKGKINYTDSTLDVWIFGEILHQVYATTKYSYVHAKNFVELSSKHSIRMLLLLERINNFSAKVPKRKLYELDELNKLFGTRYASYTIFENKVLLPSKKDLDMHSNISFIYIKNKDKILRKGRARIVGITIDLINTQPTLF